jgi:chorismate mutase
MSLKELRDQIDAIDCDLLDLLKRRTELSKQVALVKKREQLPIWDLEREQSMMEKIRQSAQEYNLNPLVVEEIFSLVLAYSKQEMRRACGAEP